MKVIFLDIDGVLNNDTTKEKSVTGLMGLNTRLLNMFLDWRKGRPEVSIVLSSTWREDPVMRQELLDFGIDFIDYTPILGVRGDEIQFWLKEHPEVTKYAILDDVQDILPSQLGNFVQTSYVHGLRPRNLKKVDAILGIDKS